MICVFWLVLTGDCVSSCAGLYQRLGMFFHVSARIRRLNVRQHFFAHMGSLTCICTHLSCIESWAWPCICWPVCACGYVGTSQEPGLEPLTARLATDLPRTCWRQTELPSATEASMYLIKALLQTGARTLPSGIWVCAGSQCLTAARLSTADAISCRHVFCAHCLRHVS
jgi:hypothetical protein